jgi:hypothetical protein
MLSWINKNRGHAVIEYVVLISMVVGALWVMQKYLTRSVSGRWKGSGDSFASGRQYSYQKTLECISDDETGNEYWYNAVCFDLNNGDCLSSKATCGSDECKNYRQANCIQRKIDCAVSTPECNDVSSKSSTTPPKCFIATAAYGSSLEPEVKSLQKFRSQVLLGSEAGKEFVDWYYHTSPPIAQKLSKQESLRTLTRGALMPIVKFSQWWME